MSPKIYLFARLEAIRHADPLVWCVGRRAGWRGVVGRLCVVEGGEGGVVEAAAGVLLPWWWGAAGPGPHQLPRVLAS